jgi:hypothetical protein
MLVFSKTSLQSARISPSTPRAIYFNDAVAVAYVPGSPSLEIVATGSGPGPAFYTLDVPAGGPPSITRRHTCLQCHQGPNTSGVPGLYVGSVIPGPTGAPLRDESAIITDHRSVFAERWGGWYVTARRGEQEDRANAVASNPADPGALVRESRQNLPSLSGLFMPYNMTRSKNPNPNRRRRRPFVYSRTPVLAAVLMTGAGRLIGPLARFV